MKTDVQIKKLGEVAVIVGGYAFKSGELSKSKEDNSFLPVIKIGNLGTDGSIHLESVQFFKFNDKLRSFLINDNDILIAMTGATVGKVAISNTKNLFLNQRVGLIRPKNDALLEDYLKYLLLDKNFYTYCQKKAGGGAQGNISPTQILLYEVNVPSLDVQQKIVEKLDAIRKLQELNKYQTSKTDEIHESLINEEIKSNEHTMVKLVEIIKPQEFVNPLKSPNDEYQYVDISSIDSENLSVDLNSVKQFKGKDAPSRARKKIEKGDILFSTVRPNLKRIAIVDFPTFNSLASTGFAVLRPDSNKVNPNYMGTITCSGIVTDQVLPQVRGAAYPAVSDNDIFNAEIPIPERKKQDEIAEKFIAVQGYKKNLIKQGELFKELFESTLNKVMRGELVN